METKDSNANGVEISNIFFSSSYFDYFALFLVYFIDLSVFLFLLCTKIMPETRNSKTSGGSPSADKNPSNEFVTTAMLNEMLQLQERMFKTLVDSLVSNFNSRRDTVVGSVAELKTRLNIFQKDEHKRIQTKS